MRIDSPSARPLLALALIALTPAALALGFAATARDDGQPERSAPLPRTVKVLADHRAYRIHDRIEDLAFTDLDGRDGRLSDYREQAALVIVLRDVHCPIAKKLGPRLGLIEREFAERSVAFLFINPTTVDTPAEMRAEAEQFGFTGRYAHDRTGSFARALKAEQSTDLFVLDAARTLRYRGAVDDQFGLTGSRPAASRHFLREALHAVLNNDEPAVLATRAPGCVLTLDEPANHHHPSDADAPITWHNQVSRIIQANCQSCHRAGGIGPFALETYAQVRGRRAMLMAVIDDGLMPPWHVAPGYGPFINDRSLAERDKEVIRAWIDRGAPEGDADEAPRARRWPTDWQIGVPDAVVAIPEAFDIPAEGILGYKYVWVKTDFPEDRWIQAMEIRPSAPQVVHHALVFLEEPPQPDESRDAIRRRWQGGLQGYFAGLVPGQGATIFPEGFARKLPAGAWLKFQIHYTANGVPATDRTEMAFIFADTPPRHEVTVGSVQTTRFVIPAGAKRHEVTASTTFREPTTLLGFSPHMHLRGAGFRYTLVTPDQRERVVLDIPRYDFGWQTMYRLTEPITVPAGTRLIGTAWYDNSAGNPANPDPTRAVRFGEQTWDEMMIGYFEHHRAAE